MLKIQVTDPTLAKPSATAWIIERLYNIGSDSANQLIIDHPSVSPNHAKLITLHKKLYLKDNNSQFGSYVNGERVTQTLLQPGDVIELGRVELLLLEAVPNANKKTPTAPQAIVKPWALISKGPWMPTKEFTVGPCAWIVGRDKHCDIVLPNRSVSRRHAEFSIYGAYLHLTDLASHNGTFVNESPIKSGYVRAGDTVRFGSYLFDVVGPDSDDELTIPSPPPNYVPAAKPALTALSESLAKAQAATKIEPTPPGEKRWKTRPTSPGNRIAEMPEAKKIHWIKIGVAIMLGLAAVALGYIFYLFVFQFDQLI